MLWARGGQLFEKAAIPDVACSLLDYEVTRAIETYFNSGPALDTIRWN